MSSHEGSPTPALDLARSHQVSSPQLCAVGADLFSLLRLKQESRLTLLVFAPLPILFIGHSQRNCCCCFCSFFYPLAKAIRFSSCFCVSAKDHRPRRRFVSSTGHCNLFTCICISDFFFLFFFVHVPPIYAVCSGWSGRGAILENLFLLIREPDNMLADETPGSWRWVLELLHLILCLMHYVR